MLQQYTRVQGHKQCPEFFASNLSGLNIADEHDRMIRMDVLSSYLASVSLSTNSSWYAVCGKPPVLRHFFQARVTRFCSKAHCRACTIMLVSTRLVPAPCSVQLATGKMLAGLLAADEAWRQGHQHSNSSNAELTSRLASATQHVCSQWRFRRTFAWLWCPVGGSWGLALPSGGLAAGLLSISRPVWPWPGSLCWLAISSAMVTCG